MNFKLYLIIVFFLILLAGNLLGISFSGGYFEAQLLSQYGSPTNLHESTRLYQEIRIGVQGQPNRYLEIRSGFKTHWQPVNESYEIDIQNWIIQVFDRPYYFMTFGFGDTRLNYSPYTVHTEEGQDNIFKGLMLEINWEKIYLHSFVGFHAEATNYIEFQGTDYKSDMGYLYAYYDNNGVINEKASFWGGINFRYNIFKESFLNLIYVHENYRIDKSGYGYYFFDNNILQSDLDMNFFNFITLKGLYAVYGQDYRAFNGDWDYFGQGRHRLVLDYSQVKFYPAYEFGTMLKSPLDNQKDVILGTQVGLFYRYIDDQYNPVHMDNGTWEENRGENFLDNLARDRKGLIYKLIQPLYRMLDIGTEFRDFKDMTDSITHKDLRVYLQFKNVFRICDCLILYRSQELEGDVFSHGSGKLSGMYIDLDIRIMDQLSSGLVYTDNKNDVKGFNEFIARLKYYF